MITLNKQKQCISVFVWARKSFAGTQIKRNCYSSIFRVLEENKNESGK